MHAPRPSRPNHFNRLTRVAGLAALLGLAGHAVPWSPWVSAQTAQLVLVSHASAGGGSLDSGSASISGEGRLVAFASEAADLVDGDTNGVADVFLFDRPSGAISRASLTAQGEQAPKRSLMPALSADGRWLAFRSDAALTGDPAPWGGIYLRDLSSGNLSLLVADDDGGRGANNFPAISSDGARVVVESAALLAGRASADPASILLWERAGGLLRRVGPASADASASGPAISNDGSTVAFASAATNLLAGPAGTGTQIYVVDLATGGIERASVATDGTPGDDASVAPTLSGNGALVAFNSLATNLVRGDVNGVSDIFLHNRTTAQTTAMTDVTPAINVNHPGDSADPVLSADGRWLAFASAMYTLTPDDRNFTWDVYLRDLSTGLMRRVSLKENGAESDSPSWAPALSADGTYMAFTATAPLIAADLGEVDDVYLRSLTASQPGHTQATATPVHGQTPTAGATHAPTGAPTHGPTHVPTALPGTATATLVHDPHPTATPHGEHPTATHLPHDPTATPHGEHPTASPPPHHDPTVTPPHGDPTVTPPHGEHPTATTSPHDPTSTPPHGEHATATSPPHHPTATPHAPGEGRVEGVMGRALYLPNLFVERFGDSR